MTIMPEREPLDYATPAKSEEPLPETPTPHIALVLVLIGFLILVVWLLLFLPSLG
jgi:hypothetical protein